jgi:hypothetical protein
MFRALRPASGNHDARSSRHGTSGRPPGQRPRGVTLYTCTCTARTRPESPPATGAPAGSCEQPTARLAMRTSAGSNQTVKRNEHVFASHCGRPRVSTDTPEGDK